MFFGLTIGLSLTHKGTRKMLTLQEVNLNLIMNVKTLLQKQLIKTNSDIMFLS